MRRIATLVVLLPLSGCVGFDEFLVHVHSLPGANPNIPMSDSENVRRALGQDPDIKPLESETGNIWPGPQRPDPTLADIQNRTKQEDERGFPPTTVPTPGLPDHRQPVPRRGSSTPPGSVEPGLPPPPNGVNVPPPPPSSVPGPGPIGRVVPTPRGNAIDSGGTDRYRQLTTPQGPGAIIVPNGNGTSTIINPNGSVQVVPTPR